LLHPAAGGTLRSTCVHSRVTRGGEAKNTMGPFIDRDVSLGDDPFTQPVDPSHSRGFLTTRRALLGLAGVLAGGHAALAAPQDSQEIKVAAEARLKLVREAMEVVRVNLNRGQFNPGERDPIYIWSRRRLEARLDMSTTKAERVAAAQEHLDEMKAVAELIKRVNEAGDVDRLVQMDADYRFLEAVSWLAREKSAK
jgi:hypothetical protein